MSTKTTKSPTLKPPLTGADHRQMALLRLVAGEGAGNWGVEELARYIVAARAIIQSKNAFDGGIDTLSIDGYVLRSDRFTNPADRTEPDKARNRVIQQIIEGNEGTTVTADAWDILSFVCSVINEAQLYGAAVMFELLEGGAR